MTTHTTTNVSPRASGRPSAPAEGHGWIVFSAIVLITAGVMRFFDAIWAFRYHGEVPQKLEDALFGHSLKTYGWIYLIVAAILVLSGAMLFSYSQVARWTGVAAGVVAAVTSIWWIPYYPIWSLTYIAIGCAIVYGLSMYGERDV